MQPVFKQEIADGVFFTAIPEVTFKTERISVNFVLPLNKKTVSANAVLPYLLARGQDLTAINRRLDALYGARLFKGVEKLGESLLVSLGIETVKDRFAANGDKPILNAAALLCELITHPAVNNGAFRSADVEAEKQNVLGLLAAMQNDKRQFARNQCISFMMEKRPFGLCPYGDAASINALTPRAMYKCWENVMRTAQIEIVYVGEGKTDAISEAFSTLSVFDRKPVAYAAPAPLKRCRRSGEIVQRMDITQAKLVMGFATDVMLPHSTAAFELFNCLFGQITTSLLFTNVRERLSLCYYCGSRYFKVNGLLLVESGVEEKNVEAAKAEVQRQLEIAAAGEFSDELIEEARLAFQNAYRSILSSLGSLERHWVTEVILGTNASPQQKAEAMEAVTKEQICAVAKSCWTDTVYLLAPNQEAGKEN